MLASQPYAMLLDVGLSVHSFAVSRKPQSPADLCCQEESPSFWVRKGAELFKRGKLEEALLTPKSRRPQVQHV